MGEETQTGKELKLGEREGRVEDGRGERDAGDRGHLDGPDKDKGGEESGEELWPRMR